MTPYKNQIVSSAQKKMWRHSILGNPVNPGKSNKSCLTADREIGRTGWGNARKGQRSSPGCKPGRSIGKRPVSPEPRGAAAVAPRHLPLALRPVNTLLSNYRSCTRNTELSSEMEVSSCCKLFLLSSVLFMCYCRFYGISSTSIIILTISGI